MGDFVVKAANVAGLQIAFAEYGITFADLDVFYLAGGFGHYLNIDSAIRIGLPHDEAPIVLASTWPGPADGGGARHLAAGHWPDIASRRVSAGSPRTARGKVAGSHDGGAAHVFARQPPAIAVVRRET